jgi:hypothetical protein
MANGYPIWYRIYRSNRFISRKALPSIVIAETLLKKSFRDQDSCLSLLKKFFSILLFSLNSVNKLFFFFYLSHSFLVEDKIALMLLIKKG